jgi:MFS family permease
LADTARPAVDTHYSPAPSEGVAFGVSRYYVLLAFGASYSVGAQMASVSVVLPFLLAQKGIYWAAGLLYPTFSIGFIAGNALSPLVVERSRRRQNVVIATAAATIAALTLCIAAADLRDVLVVPVFLLASLVIGCAMGMANNAYAEIISRMLDRTRRNQLLLNQEAVGAVLTVATTLLILPLVSGRDPAEGRIDVLWLGAVAMAAACVAATIVGPTMSGALRPPRRFIDDYREGITVVRTRSWYRLFLATQIVFVPISLSMTFFSLRAAMAHADKAGSLHVLVISSAAGLLAGSFLWRRVFSRRGVRGMLAISGTISSAAALICLANEVIPDREQLWVHSVVFFLATLANAAIGAATVSWISAFATEDRRAMLISFAAALAAVVSTVLGAVLGTIAQATVAPWPVMIVLALAVLATTVAIRAPDRPPAT